MFAAGAAGRHARFEWCAANHAGNLTISAFDRDINFSSCNRHGDSVKVSINSQGHEYAPIENEEAGRQNGEQAGGNQEWQNTGRQEQRAG